MHVHDLCEIPQTAFTSTHSTEPSLRRYSNVMDNLLVEGLSYGACIEIFYNVSTQDGSSKKVWWPCNVEKISLVQDKRGTTISASLRYQAMLGFRSCTEQVIFREDQEVQDKDGTRYSWSFPPCSLKSEDGQSSSEESGGRDESYDPTNSRVLGKRQACEMEQGGGDHEEQGLQNQRDIRRLDRVVSSLQREVSEQARRIVELQGGAGSSRKVCKEYNYSPLLPLKFLCLRLRTFLEKIPSVPAKSSAVELRDGFSFCSQELFRRTSDCTLLQFDEIADHVHGMSDSGAEFFPSYEVFKENPQAEARIVFRTFSSFISVFKAGPPDTLRDCIIKRRVDRTSGTTSAVRYLGCVLQSCQDTSAPMHLLVGCSAPREVDGGRQMSAIVRDDTTWNSIEGCFHNQLYSVSSSVSEFIERAKLALGESDYARHVNKYSFAITWKKESDTELGRLLTPNPHLNDVLGVLEITLPYVLIRGQPVCQEFSLLVLHNQSEL